MIKYDNLFYILNGGDTFRFNRKLLVILGIELCALVIYLIERALNREEKDELIEKILSNQKVSNLQIEF